MSPPLPSTATTSARTYYDSPSTDAFYTLLWGGQDIHIGIYDSPSLPIAEASQRSVEKLVTTVIASGIQIDSRTRILDLGAGYGGAARYLARTYGCEVVCLNLSSVQNARNEELTKEAGLDGLITVVGGSFEHVPPEVLEGGRFGVVWSQDSFLHSSDREKIIDEISRCMVDGSDGRVVFTDI
ncbi:MAG: hypothetical protein Q9218_007756, partial [Villophora microphyllina]